MLWKFISQAILQFRVAILLVVAAITTYCITLLPQVETSYNFSSFVPDTDEELKFYKQFKATFGEDANIFAIGLEDKKIYELKHFQAFQDFTQKLAKLHGVTQVLALPRAVYLVKDTANKKFEARNIFPAKIATQAALDSLIGFVKQLKFYDGQLISPTTQATLALLSIRKDVLDSKARMTLVEQVLAAGKTFSDQTGIQLHYAGVPLVRTVMTKKLGDELKILLVLSVLMTAVVLYVFFRSFKAVIVPLLIIGILILWTLGLLVTLGYKITILTALLPPILVVIGIPNCVYLLNKYHQEYRATGDQKLALQLIIQKIGIVTLMTNATTAIGFFVFVFVEVKNLQQFGILSSLGVVNAFVLSLMLMPIFYSFFPPPSEREMQHLDRKPTQKAIRFLHHLAFNHRPLIYVAAAIITVVSLIGFWQIKVVSFMVDDIPETSNTKKDLRFFERNFKGVMPMEIVVNTGKKKGVLRASTLRKIDEFETELRKISLLSPPISVISFIKATRQAFYNQEAAFYELPTNQDRGFVLNYLSQSQDSTQLINAFVDTTGQQMRISFKIADIGSIRMDSLVKQGIQPVIKKVFFSGKEQDAESKFDVHVTGTTLLFIKGNQYLISNLKSSILLAIVIIAFLMATLFASFRIILISVFTNLLPLLLTAGLMGFLGVPLKPSTALIFSVAFGIAVDDAIHFLARYRQAYKAGAFTVPEAVSISLHEMGAGMMYTSIILFFGFIVFTVSEFDGTVALGSLTATTLIAAMLANLIVLPALLLSFDKFKAKKGATQPTENEQAAPASPNLPKA
ncbi:MAG TPA: hypothetical protein DCM08_05245 [Microscillaceae bacterium]|nr:hypothetical protein [Microscillaceae bacterium]